jgi:acyl-CoA-binding domain-containing protein 6
MSKRKQNSKSATRTTSIPYGWIALAAIAGIGIAAYVHYRRSARRRSQRSENLAPKAAQSSSSLFERASRHARAAPSDHLSTSDRLGLYALFKQATCGVCNVDKPPLYDQEARYKWSAWHELGASMGCDEAERRYVDLVASLFSGFSAGDNDIDDEAFQVAVGNAKKKKEKKRSMGPVFSRPQLFDDDGDDDYDNDDGDDNELVDAAERAGRELVEAAKIGDVDAIRSALARHDDVDVDYVGRSDDLWTPLHWACDGGHVDVVRVLVERGANVDAADVDGRTALHTACCCEHADIVELLLARSANVNLTDGDGVLAKQETDDEAILQLFAANET